MTAGAGIGGSCTGDIWTCGRCLVGQWCYVTGPPTDSATDTTGEGA